MGNTNALNQLTLVCTVPKDQGRIHQVTTGYSHTLIMFENGAIYGCGYNGYGELAIGNTSNQPSFVKIENPFGSEV